MHAGYLGGVWTAVKLGIGAGTVALLVGLQPVLTALWISATAGNDDPSRARVSSRQWLGLCMGLLGITMVVWHKLFDGEITLLNLTCAALALASITCGTLYQKRNLVGSDVRTGNAIQLLAAFVVTLPLAMLETEPIRWHPQMVGALMWSVFALSLGGSSLLYLLIQRGAATQVTSLLYLVPPCTALMAWWLFDEALTWPMLAGTMLTVSAWPGWCAAQRGERARVSSQTCARGRRCQAGKHAKPSLESHGRMRIESIFALDTGGVEGCNLSMPECTARVPCGTERIPF